MRRLVIVKETMLTIPSRREALKEIVTRDRALAVATSMAIDIVMEVVLWCLELRRREGWWVDIDEACGAAKCD
jgi:hypothetical protein